MKFLTLLSIFCLLNALYADAQFSKNEESLFKSQYLTLAKNFGLDDKNTNDFVLCCMDKLKARAESIAQSSHADAQKLRRAIADECLAPYKVINAWTTETEKTIKSALIQLKPVQVLSQAKKELLSNCVIAKLKTAYPKGYEKTGGNTMLKLASDCKKEIQ